MFPVRLGCADEHAVGYVPGYPSHRLCPRGTAVVRQVFDVNVSVPSKSV